MKTTNKGTKRLLMSVAAMAIAIVGAATSTYAWFTMNVAPQVGKFTVKAATINGLEIALDNRDAEGKIGDTEVDYTELSYSSYVSGLSIEQIILQYTSANAALIPSQTLDGINFFDSQGIQSVGNRFTGTASDEFAYFDFTLYFRTQSSELSGKSIAVDLAEYSIAGATPAPNSYVTAGEDGATYFDLPKYWLGNTSDRDALITSKHIYIENPSETPTVITGINMFLYTQDDDYKASHETLTDGYDTYETFVNPADGSAFVVEYDTESVLEPKKVTEDIVISKITPNKIIGNSANAMRLSFSGISAADLGEGGNFNNGVEGNAAVIWDPRAAHGTFKSDLYADNFALHMLKATSDYPTNSEFVDSYMKTHAGNASYENTNYDNAAKLDEAAICTLSNSANLNSGEYNYGAVKVRIWLDGWDAECFNGIMSSQANIGIQFKALN